MAAAKSQMATRAGPIRRDSRALSQTVTWKKQARAWCTRLLQTSRLGRQAI